MFETTGELVAALQGGKVSASELLEQSIARIDKLDAEINAVVVRDFERARVAAAAADVAIRQGDRRPLLGITMTVKEAINVAGLPTTWGLPGTQNIPVHEDAVVIQRLKAAGAVIVGKTNVSTHLADWQSYNAVYGTTRNPWDPDRTPGGSSGGSAAALAAGYVPLELGTDIGGSLRIPAHFCGVYSHKPSHGLVPMRGTAPPGIAPLPTSPGVDFAVTGPMARSAGDLALALDVLAGPDVVQATAYRLALPAPRHTELADFRVLVLDTHPLVPTSADVQAALHRLAGQLAASGCRVAHASPLVPDLAALAAVFTPMLMSVFGADLPAPAYRELQASAARLATDDRSAAALQLRGFVMTHRDWMHADRQRHAIANQWRELFRSVDIVLCPVSPTTAFVHDHGDIQARRLTIDGNDVPYTAQSLWITLATLAGLPATVMPIGLSPAGLPIGAQLVGPFLEDRTTLEFARLAEREYGGFIAPPAIAAPAG